MHYDPIKNILGNFFNRKPWLRKLFYRLLDIHLLRSWHVKKHLRQWEKEMKGPARILDAGAGFGQYTYYLARLSHRFSLFAVDVKSEQVEECNRFFSHTPYAERVRFRVADLTDFKAEEPFDLIISVDVMEHILEDRQVFSNFSDSLAPGGMLLISTPSDQGGSGVHHEHDESFIGEHVRDGYSVEEIKEKLLSAGFNRTAILYTYGKPGQISWKLGMKIPITLAGRHRLWLLLLPLYFLLTYPLILILNCLDTHINHSSGTGLIVRAWK